MTPENAALEALITHLTTALSGQVTVIRGWPSAGQKLELAEGPKLAVMLAGRAKWERCAPELLNEAGTDQGEGVSAYLYRVATGEQLFELDVWAAYRPGRDEAAAAADAALDNQAPLASGLLLTTDYHEQTVRFDVRGPDFEDSSAGPSTGEWRASWLLSATLWRLVQVEHPRQIYGAEIAWEE